MKMLKRFTACLIGFLLSSDVLAQVSLSEKTHVVLFAEEPPAVEINEDSPQDDELEIVFSGGGGVQTLFINISFDAGLRVREMIEFGVGFGAIATLGAGAAYVGPYFKLVPVPYGLGKRFYAYGRAYRAWVFTRERPLVPGPHYFHLAEWGIGYRAFAESERRNGTYRFIELGVVQELDCREGLAGCEPGRWLLPSLRFGTTTD